MVGWWGGEVVGWWGGVVVSRNPYLTSHHTQPTHYHTSPSHIIPSPPYVYPRNRIDVFAVRQWPGNGADLDFRGVLAGCTAAIVAAAPIEGKLTEKDPFHSWGSYSQRKKKEFLSSEEYAVAAKVLPFCRLWYVVYYTTPHPTPHTPHPTPHTPHLTTHTSHRVKFYNFLQT